MEIVIILIVQAYQRMRTCLKRINAVIDAHKKSYPSSKLHLQSAVVAAHQKFALRVTETSKADT